MFPLLPEVGVAPMTATDFGLKNASRLFTTGNPVQWISNLL